MIKIIEKIGFKTYLCDDESIQKVDIDISGALLNECNLPIYEVIGGIVREIDYTDPANEDDYQDAIAQKEINNQAIVRQGLAMKELATIPSVIKDLQLKVFTLQAQVTELQSQLKTEIPTLVEWFRFEDTFNTIEYIDIDRCVNLRFVEPNSGNDMDGIIRPINKNEPMIMITKNLNTIIPTLKNFYVVGHGAVPEYNYGLVINLLDSNYDEVQLYDKDDAVQPYVQYSGTEKSLSDIMHVSPSSVTDIIFKITIVPQGINPEAPVTGMPFVSAYSLVYTN